jgi:hypothetical protein
MPYLGNKPADKPLTAADITDSIITSAKIVDATIANADIANSTINLTTKVTGTLPVANGGTGLTALGTAAQVLRVNSGATALEYATPSSGAFVFLGATGAQSAVATIDLNGYFTSDYNVYKIFVDGLFNATNNGSFRMKVATTSSYTLQTSNYNVTEAEFGSMSTALGTTVARNSAVEITIFNPLGTTGRKCFLVHAVGGFNDDTPQGLFGYNIWNSTTAVTGLRFYSNGNTSVNNIRLYGVKNS